ncbi:MAG: hypothetical protein ACKPJE_25840 [Microcystis panniformis]
MPRLLRVWAKSLSNPGWRRMVAASVWLAIARSRLATGSFPSCAWVS